MVESDVSIAKVLVIFSFAPLESRTINLGNISHRRFQRSLALGGIKTFSGAIAGEPSFIGKTTCYHLLLSLFIIIMGKSKEDAGKEIVPSTTRAGKDLPTQKNFSPDVAATPAIKKKSVPMHSSPLSKMYMPTDTENELLGVSLDDEETLDLSNPTSSETPEPSKETTIIKAIVPMSPIENAAFGKVFMDMDLDDLDNFDAYHAQGIS